MKKNVEKRLRKTTPSSRWGKDGCVTTEQKTRLEMMENGIECGEEHAPKAGLILLLVLVAVVIVFKTVFWISGLNG